MAQKIDGKWEIGKIYYTLTDDGIDSFWMPLEYDKSIPLLKSIVYFVEDGIWWAGELKGDDAKDQINSISLIYEKPDSSLVLHAADTLSKKLPKLQKEFQKNIQKYGSRPLIQFCFMDF